MGLFKDKIVDLINSDHDCSKIFLKLHEKKPDLFPERVGGTLAGNYKLFIRMFGKENLFKPENIKRMKQFKTYR